jgi:hypothetical protein
MTSSDFTPLLENRVTLYRCGIRSHGYAQLRRLQRLRIYLSRWHGDNSDLRGLARPGRFIGANDVYHLAFVKDDKVLVGRRVAEADFFLAAHRLDFADSVFKEMRLMTAVAFVG